MMNKTWKRPNPYFAPGMQVKGKWHKNIYTVKRKLGSGAIGTVYLCESAGDYAALKVSDKGSSITTEVNVLKAIDQAQGNKLGPYLLDVDDWVAQTGEQFSFYVMEYINGEPLSDFVRQHGHVWLGVFMLQLLDDLENLHQLGWVFGDLKMDNLLVSKSPTRVRWVDVGGTTRIGRAIKEYTEFYDRGYWELGSRRAEPSYDLFSFAMIFLSVYHPNHFVKRGNSRQFLFRKLDAIKPLQPYNYSLKKAILGKYQSSAEMKQDISKAIFQAKRKTQNHKEKVPIAIESVGLMSLAIIYYLTSIYLF
ncbi:protein kinase family protein [Virgibacillus sp. MSJ-26]|uniref:protein kinase domain-containing protein n=1 Tax=Virgibacillus sp. MSJ-26 TaxID=2841522 RepID=UPI00352FF92E